MTAEINRLFDELSDQHQSCAAQTAQFSELMHTLNVEWNDAAGKRFYQLSATDAVDTSEKFLAGAADYLAPSEQFVAQATLIVDVAAQQDAASNDTHVLFQQCDALLPEAQRCHQDVLRCHENCSSAQNRVADLLRRV